MKWSSPLQEATLVKRYKRFLADIHFNNQKFTAHVPNTGSMLSCWEPEWKCAISTSDNPNRKMPHTLELTWNGETWIGVNTANANKLALQWLQEGKIPELIGYAKIQPEKKINEKSRIDFYLEGHGSAPPCYVEVKSVTLKKDGIAQFPDSVSERGQKHLQELIKLKTEGLRAAMLYIVQREDVSAFMPATELDPEYSKLFYDALNAGVEILIYQCKMDLTEISFKRSLPLH